MEQGCPVLIFESGGEGGLKAYGRVTSYQQWHGEALWYGAEVVSAHSEVGKLDEGSEGQRIHVPLTQQIPLQLQDHQVAQTLNTKNMNTSLFLQQSNKNYPGRQNSKFTFPSVWQVLKSSVKWGTFVIDNSSQDHQIKDQILKTKRLLWHPTRCALS